MTGSTKATLRDALVHYRAAGDSLAEAQAREHAAFNGYQEAWLDAQTALYAHLDAEGRPRPNRPREVIDRLAAKVRRAATGG